MLPGYAAPAAAGSAITSLQRAAQSRVSPEAAAQRDMATRIARLQAMHQQLTAAGDPQADQVAGIISELQTQATPGSMKHIRPLAMQRNAFAGMGAPPSASYGTVRRQ